MNTQDVPAAARISTRSATAAFFYKLLRDDLPAGVVEKIVQDIEGSQASEFLLSNEYLAQYAIELATRLEKVGEK